MLRLRWAEGCEPKYQTELSAGIDLRARQDRTLGPGERAAVPCGVWIESVDRSAMAAEQILELQLRARSGLALKKGLCLANGVGTIDADYRDEICALLWNSSADPLEIQAGERIAQLVAAWALRIAGVTVGGQRSGGFGSTGSS